MDLAALIERICEDYLEQLLASSARSRRAPSSTGSIAPEVERFLSDEEDRMLVGDRSLVEADARKLLADTGYQLDEDEFEQLCVALQRTFIRGCRLSHT